jgi:predicted phage terminase large subunit-like protein
MDAAAIAQILPKLSSMPIADQVELLKLLEGLEDAKDKEKAKGDFLTFVKRMWPGFIEGSHHRIMADVFNRVLRGECKRVIINLAPRHSKSEFASYLLPAWFMGNHPEKKIIQATHTAELAVDFGRKVRNLIKDESFQSVFPDVGLRADSTAAGRWNTTANGVYFAVGVGGAIAGKGADLFIIDDPHALPLNTEVPTPLGFKTIEELKVGDEVFGPDGVPVKILAKSDVWKNRKLYRLTTDDGEEVMCDGGHLWTYHSATALKNQHILKTKTARELATWDKPNKPYLPRHWPTQYPEAELLVDPYILGAWLGDGTTGLGRMTSHPDDSLFMRGEFEKAGYETTTLKDVYSFGVLKLRAQLRDLGILYSKKIPENYLTSSINQRMALLQGLMDTDGNVTKDGECSFNNTNQTLVLQFRQILHSLGVKAKILFYQDSRVNHSTIYRVNFKLGNCCRMPRKNERTYTPTDKRRRSFTVTETEEFSDVQCITVDRPDGLFLVGRGYVVTHNSEQEAIQAAHDPKVFEKVYEWYSSGPRQRLQPNAAIVVVQTRWGVGDLTGRLVQASIDRGDGDQWEVIELPAILPSGEPMWPAFWSKPALEALKAELPASKWNAQYQQQPTSEEGAIIKREWWRRWDKKRLPNCEYIIIASDTAFTKNNRSDYSAFTVWGVFENENEGGSNIIMLDAWKDRLEFPDLKAKAIEIYKEWEPDTFLIEAKASGLPLIHELRQAGVMVSEFTPTRASGDKVMRANSISDIFASGVVWAPTGNWANEVIEECAAFPVGAHDDYVDTVIMALMRYRQGGLLRLPSDDEDDYSPPARAEYY